MEFMRMNKGLLLMAAVTLAGCQTMAPEPADFFERNNPFPIAVGMSKAELEKSLVLSMAERREFSNGGEELVYYHKGTVNYQKPFSFSKDHISKEVKLTVNLSSDKKVSSFHYDKTDVVYSEPLMKGINLMRAGDYAESIRIFTDMLAENSEFIQPRILRGFSYLATHRYEESFEDYSYAYELNPKPDLLGKMGIIKSETQEYEKAVDFYNQVIKQEPENTDVYYLRGIAYLRLKDTTRAVSDFDYAKAKGYVIPKKIQEELEALRKGVTPI